MPNPTRISLPRVNYNFDAAATILYIDEMDNVFIEWSDGKLSSFSDKQVLHSFEKIAY